jgi:hypothetical protein
MDYEHLKIISKTLYIKSKEKESFFQKFIIYRLLKKKNN